MARISVALCFALVALVAHGHVLRPANTNAQPIETKEACLLQLEKVATSIFQLHNGMLVALNGTTINKDVLMKIQLAFETINDVATVLKPPSDTEQDPSAIRAAIENCGLAVETGEKAVESMAAYMLKNGYFKSN
ncbi:uncharacterized protein [Venturia canescens]|uniref:uncharacterized protein n=1 Tax=Venturia canescens TaxID=32260 RepID=UPI001C9BC75C|nr:uncharacterized protein LOC122418776 [Venturia canescens]